MAGINKVILVGHLGADPELKYGTSGNPFCNFTMATSESWVKDGNREERTEWHRIVAFGKVAEICAKYLHKGRQIYCEGKLQTRSWEQDGVKRYTTEIVMQTMQMLGARGDGQQSQSQQHTQGSSSQAPPQQQSFGGMNQGSAAPQGDYGAPDDIPF